MLNSVSDKPLTSFFNEVLYKPSKVVQITLIAVSVLMTLGVALSYFLGAPWFITAAFFALSLSPLFTVWKTRNPHSDRVE